MNLNSSMKHSVANRDQRIRAAWLVTGVGEPLRGGCVVVRDGRVVKVESSSAGPIDVELEDSILMPGLINSHTHLEFSGLENPISADGGFVEWVRKVIAFRQNRWGDYHLESQVTQRKLDLRNGLEESWRQGTVAIADIATSPYPMGDLLNDIQWSPVVHWGLGEVLGWKEERQHEMRTAFAEMQREATAYETTSRDSGGKLETGRSNQAPMKSMEYRWGISPHAPYSTSPRMIQWCIEKSRWEQRLLAMHLGETPEEMEWCRGRTGVFAELLERLGVGKVPMLPQWRSPRDYLEQLSRAWRTLIVHGNYLSAEDWDILARNRDRMSVVFCPRTHQFFGHSRYPLQKMREAGVRVVVGTDSRASNPDLSVWRELQTIATGGGGLSSPEILALATSQAAEGLGIEAELGTIQPGRLAYFSKAKILEARGLAIPVQNFWERLWDNQAVALPESLRS